MDKAELHNQLKEEITEREHDILNCRECLLNEKRSSLSVCEKHSRQSFDKELIKKMDRIVELIK